jgi:hypothetical protein
VTKWDPEAITHAACPEGAVRQVRRLDDLSQYPEELLLSLLKAVQPNSAEAGRLIAALHKKKAVK